MHACIRHWLKRSANCNQQPSREQTLGPCIEPPRATVWRTFARTDRSWKRRAAAALLSPPRAPPTLLSLAACQLCGSSLAASTAASIKPLLSKDARQKNQSRAITKAVGEQDLHMVTLCEVGGHKEGLGKSTARAQDLVSQVLTGHCKATSCQAYMATWQAEHEPTDDTSVTLTLSGEPEIVELPFPLQPQLVIMDFTIAASEHRDKHGNLISGNLHIRIPKRAIDQPKKTDHEGSAAGLGAESVDCEQWRFSAYCASHCAHRRREPGQERKRHHRAK